MELKMTEKQFRRLLDLVYIGNWVLNSTRGDDRIKEYDQVESLVFAHCLDHGMAPLTELYQGELIPSRAFADGGIHEAIMAYEDNTFFEILAQNELALQFFQLGFFRPGMEQQALACLDMMDFDGKEQVLQKIRSGTQDALWQRMALTLAQRYEPELFASLTDSAQGMRADVRLEGEKTPAQVRQARKRAAEAAQPE